MVVSVSGFRSMIGVEKASKRPAVAFGLSTEGLQGSPSIQEAVAAVDHLIKHPAQSRFGDFTEGRLRAGQLEREVITPIVEAVSGNPNGPIDRNPDVHRAAALAQTVIAWQMWKSVQDKGKLFIPAIELEQQMDKVRVHGMDALDGFDKANALAPRDPATKFNLFLLKAVLGKLHEIKPALDELRTAADALPSTQLKITKEQLFSFLFPLTVNSDIKRRLPPPAEIWQRLNPKTFFFMAGPEDVGASPGSPEELSAALTPSLLV